jgi:hypothetical protein
LGTVRDPRFVVVEIEDAEAAQHGWKAGFYLSDLSPKKQRSPSQKRRPRVLLEAVGPAHVATQRID